MYHSRGGDYVRLGKYNKPGYEKGDYGNVILFTEVT